MREAEVRDQKDDDEEHVRMKWNHQYIINSTLKGEHGFLDNHALRLNWSAVASKAYNETPDNAEVGLLDGGNRVAVTMRWFAAGNTIPTVTLPGYLDLNV